FRHGHLSRTSAGWTVGACRSQQAPALACAGTEGGTPGGVVGLLYSPCRVGFATPAIASPTPKRPGTPRIPCGGAYATETPPDVAPSESRTTADPPAKQRD